MVRTMTLGMQRGQTQVWVKPRSCQVGSDPGLTPHGGVYSASRARAGALAEEIL